MSESQKHVERGFKEYLSNIGWFEVFALAAWLLVFLVSVENFKSSKETIDMFFLCGSSFGAGYFLHALLHNPIEIFWHKTALRYKHLIEKSQVQVDALIALTESLKRKQQIEEVKNANIQPSEKPHHIDAGKQDNSTPS